MLVGVVFPHRFRASRDHAFRTGTPAKGPTHVLMKSETIRYYVIMIQISYV